MAEQGARSYWCWMCNGKLADSYRVINFNGSGLKVHICCRKDAENLLFRNEVTFCGEPIVPDVRKESDY